MGLKWQRHYFNPHLPGAQALSKYQADFLATAYYPRARNKNNGSLQKPSSTYLFLAQRLTLALSVCRCTYLGLCICRLECTFHTRIERSNVHILWYNVNNHTWWFIFPRRHRLVSIPTSPDWPCDLRQVPCLTHCEMEQ